MMLVLSDRKNQQILGSLLASSLVIIGGCNNSAAIESALSPDPQLQKSIDTIEFEGAATTTTGAIADGTQTKSKTNITQTTQNQNPESAKKTALSVDRLPRQIPIYPQATLKNIEPSSTVNRGKANWDSPHEIRPIARYYQNELQARGWEVVQPFDLEAKELNQVAIANKDNLEVTIALENSAVEKQGAARHTKLTIAYQPIETKADNKPELSSANDSGIESSQADKPSLPNVSATVTSNDKTKNEVYFSDLDEVPEQLRDYVKDVAALGILNPYTKEGNVELSQFAPNQPVTRSEYANWLIAANNIYHANSPGDKIYLANKSDRVVFQDVKNSDPNFGAIQGLAEAGLVPSMLSDDSSKLLFQPNAPLTRVDLIAWKVPLDVRKALPDASLDAISKSWGFQDVTKVEPAELKALFADFQNGDRSNIRRIFGYTTLFQPQKPVTRAEAAASLWYFGFQGDGITAKEALASEP